MNRAAGIGRPLPALALALGLACAAAAPLRADYQMDERVRIWNRINGDVWQAVFGQRVVAEARRQLGRPYVWGGAGPGGFDCSGYTAYVFRGLGVPLARTAVEQFRQGTEVRPSGLLPGDLVFFTGLGAPLHVGIYEGDGLFLHAPGAGKVIRSARLAASYFAAHFVGARRLTPSLEQERRLRARAAEPAPAAPGRPAPSPSPVPSQP